MPTLSLSRLASSNPRPRSLALTAALLASGAAFAEEPAPKAPPYSVGKTCPMNVQDATVRVVEGTEKGKDGKDGSQWVALAFTTKSKADVAELRRRVALMAEMHNDDLRMHGPGQGMHGGRGPMARPGDHRGRHGGMRGMMGGPMMMMTMLDTTARVENIEGGARLVLTPKDPAELPALREHLRARATRMSSGTCPLVGDPA